MGEDHNFVGIRGWKWLTESRTPPDDFFTRQHTVRHHLLESFFVDDGRRPLALKILSSAIDEDCVGEIEGMGRRNGRGNWERRLREGFWSKDTRFGRGGLRRSGKP